MPSTRDRLVAAARAELDDKGYPAIRVDDIARRAGLTTGAIYASFPPKHDLLLAAAMITRDLDQFREAAEREGRSTSPADDGSSTTDRLLAATLAEPVRPAVGAQLGRRHRALASLVEGAKATGLVSADVPSDGLAYVVQLLALGNVVGQAIGLEPPDRAEVTEALDRLGEGLGARGRTP